MIKRVIISTFVVLCSTGHIWAVVQAKGTLKGKLEDEKGRPVAGVVIHAMSSRTRSTEETQTNETGAYSFELAPDDYVLSFEAAGFQGVTLTVMQQVEEGKQTEVRTIQLEKAKKPTSLVRGSVFTSEGFSLPGVKVKLKRVPSEEEQKSGKRFKKLSMDYVTNRQGEFAFRLPSEQARYELTASRDGFTSQSKIVDVGENESVPVAFSLEISKK